MKYVRVFYLFIEDQENFSPIFSGLKLLFKLKDSYEEFEFIPPFKEGRHLFINYLFGDNILKYSLSELKEKF